MLFKFYYCEYKPFISKLYSFNSFNVRKTSENILYFSKDKVSQEKEYWERRKHIFFTVIVEETFNDAQGKKRRNFPIVSSWPKFSPQGNLIEYLKDRVK